MHIAVAIVSYGSWRDVTACLAALEASTHKDFEVVICENGGPEPFAVLRGAIPAALGGGQPVRLVLAPGNLGFAGGVNLCLRETAAADAWWILNPDTEADPGAMAAMAARLARGDCDAVGSVLRLDDDRVQSYGGRWRRALARAVSLGYGAQATLPVDEAAIEATQNYLNGASMLVGRRFVDAVGPMREDYFLYCEEVEWCLRGLARGMRLGFASAATVLHHQGTSTGNVQDLRSRSPLSTYLGERNKLLLTHDRFPAWTAPATLAALALLILRFGRAGAWRQLAYAFAGWWAGVMGERGPSKLAGVGVPRPSAAHPGRH